MALLDKYPFDLAACYKGQHFTVETLEQITGAKCGTPQYRLKVLGVMSRINSKTDMTAKTVGDALRILTDQEAAAYNHRLFEQNVSGLINRYGKEVQVDASNLLPDQQKTHDKNLLIDGRQVQVIRQARREYRIAAPKQERLRAPMPSTARTHFTKPD